MLDAMCEPAPFFADLAQGPDGGQACWLTATDGVRLRAGIWPWQGDGPCKGTVLILCGRTEYAEKYGRTAGDLAQRGFATLAIDWRGQGLADRLLPDPGKGHVDRFSDYQLDLHAVIDAARACRMPEPFYMIAHSMGGCIGLRALMEGVDVRAAVFSAPMWDIEMAGVMRAVAWAIGNAATLCGCDTGYAPGTTRESIVNTTPFPGNKLTTDRDMWDYMHAQTVAHPEMALGGPSVRWVHEALTECAALARLPAPDVPAICFLGGHERIVAPGAIRTRMAGWTNGTLDIIDGAEHEIMMERPSTRQRFFDATAALFEAHR